MNAALRAGLTRAVLTAAFLLALTAAADVMLSQRQRLLDAIAVIDITGSMNTRDMDTSAGPESRIAAARASLVAMLKSVPCGSKLGLGIFTERRSFLLFEPVEVCGNYDALSAAIRGIDWRMAWEGDSYIAKGLYSSIEVAQSLKAGVMFFTDGHEAPPLPFTGVPPFEGKPGEVNGLIVGVGGEQKSPIPKFDENGQEIGVYAVTDVPHDNRSGPAPESGEHPAGWHPRNAPFGAAPAVGDEHLSSLRAEYLKRLAGMTGLSFVDLKTTHDLASAMIAAGATREVNAVSSISRWPAGLALVLLVLLYLPDVVAIATSRAPAKWALRNQ